MSQLSKTLSKRHAPIFGSVVFTTLMVAISFILSATHGATRPTTYASAVSAFSSPGSNSANFASAIQSSDPFAPCVPAAANAIACENSKPGTPSGVWDIIGAGDEGIQGYATEISVNRGQTVRFKIK